MPNYYEQIAARRNRQPGGMPGAGSQVQYDQTVGGAMPQQGFDPRQTSTPFNAPPPAPPPMTAAPVSSPADPLGQAGLTTNSFDPASGGWANPLLASYGGPAGEYGYNEITFPQMFFDDPTFTLMDIFPGIDPLSAGYGQLANLPFDPLSLMATLGAPGTIGMGPDEAMAMYEGLMEQMATGGAHLDFQSVLSNIMNAAPDSQLGYLLQNNPGLASGMMQAALAGAARMSLTPWVSQTLDNQLSGMMAPMINAASKLSPLENVPGAINPRDYLQQGLSRLGFGF